LGVSEDVGNTFLTGGEEGEGVVEIFLDGGEDFGKDGAGGHIDLGEERLGFSVGFIEEELRLGLGVGIEPVEVWAAGIAGARLHEVRVIDRGGLIREVLRFVRGLGAIDESRRGLLRLRGLDKIRLNRLIQNRSGGRLGIFLVGAEGF